MSHAQLLVPHGTLTDEPHFLVVRRDNIGDLVCTTPLIAALRERFPRAWIGVLANSYNAPVLAGNPDVDEVFAYRKSKHGHVSRLGVLAERVRIAIALRRRRVDFALVATPTFQKRVIRFARWSGARIVAGFAEIERDRKPRLDIAIPIARDGRSEVEDVFRIGAPFGLEGKPPPLKVVPDSDVVARAMNAASGVRRESGLLIGVHVSARKPSQRWPEERTIEVMRVLAERHHASFMLFWAPGAEDSRTHPGDDAKARRILEAVGGQNVLPWPSVTLADLTGGMAACDMMVMSDGGAMHIAAALGKPIVCMFGRSDATRWRPWGVPHELLQPSSQNVGDVSVEAVISACDRLLTLRPREARAWSTVAERV